MRVYKFLSTENAQRVLAEKRLKIATFHDMNDPFELSGVRLTTIAELREKTDEMYFVNLDGRIALSEVILGIRCAVDHEEIVRCLTPYPGEIRIISGIASETEFKILEDPAKTMIRFPPPLSKTSTGTGQ